VLASINIRRTWWLHEQLAGIATISASSEELVIEGHVLGLRLVQIVEVTWTACPFGGERAWFVCPNCQNRRAVLYSVGGDFRCVRCEDLAYASTHEDAVDRAHRRIRRLKERLGGDPDSLSLPDPPKGMHGGTYSRIVAQIDAQERKILAIVTPQIAALEMKLRIG
jgi:hypothetical protein